MERSPHPSHRLLERDRINIFVLRISQLTALLNIVLVIVPVNPNWIP